MAKRVKGLWCESFKYNNKWVDSSTEAHSAAKPQLKSIEPRIHHRWTRMERSDFLTPPEMDRNSCFDAGFNKTFSAPLRLCAKIACFSCPFLSQHPRAVLPQRRRDAENFQVFPLETGRFPPSVFNGVEKSAAQRGTRCQVIFRFPRLFQPGIRKSEGRAVSPRPSGFEYGCTGRRSSRESGGSTF